MPPISDRELPGILLSRLLSGYRSIGVPPRWLCMGPGSPGLWFITELSFQPESSTFDSMDHLLACLAVTNNDYYMVAIPATWKGSSF